MRFKIIFLGVAYIIAALTACGGGGSEATGNPGAVISPSNDTIIGTPTGTTNDATTGTTTGSTVSAANSTTNTSTAAYGMLGTSTTRVAFLPAPGGVRPLLLENSGTQTVSWGNIGLSAPPTVLFTFPVSSCMVDSRALKGVCIGFDSSRIGVMDLSKFITTLQVSDINPQEFDSGAGSVATKFSGTSCIVCGVAADVGKQRFIISGTGGYRVFNYGSPTAAAVYAIPVAENFGLLPQETGSSYIIAPEYEPNGGNRKLRVINIDSRKIYVWTKNTDSLTDLGAAGNGFELSDVDAASVDINTKMIALSNEHSGDFMLIDLARAEFNDDTLTFNAPFDFAKPNPATTVTRLTDIAISTTGSILLSHSESASNIGITQLPTSLGTNGVGIGPLGVLNLNDPDLDRTACGANFAFFGKGDPHGLSVYVGLDNKQRGLVVDENDKCAAIIDLVGLRDAPHSATDPNNFDISSVAVRSMVKFIKLE